MALGFGMFGWLLGAPLTPLLLDHEHHDAAGAHYRHVDGSEGTILALASAAVLAAVAWAIALAVTVPASARSQAAGPPGRVTRWVAATPAVLFLATQAPAWDTSCLVPLVVGTAIHALLGAGALALARGCTDTLTRRFAVLSLDTGLPAPTRERSLVVSDAALSHLARAGPACRAPPFLPAL